MKDGLPKAAGTDRGEKRQPEGVELEALRLAARGSHTEAVTLAALRDGTQATSGIFVGCPIHTYPEMVDALAKGGFAPLQVLGFDAGGRWPHHLVFRLSDEALGVGFVRFDDPTNSGNFPREGAPYGDGSGAGAPVSSSWAEDPSGEPRPYGTFRVLVASSCEGAHKRALDVLRPLFGQVGEEVEEDNGTSAIYSLAEGRQGPEIVTLGYVPSVLERGNYDPGVMEGYDFVIKEFGSASPKARLVLLDGPPGSGKTHLIQGFLGALKGCRCIIVPPKLLPNLAGPEFLRALMGHDDPTLLVLEDADDCLIAREKNEAAKEALSALLNMSDGIWGKALNLRVVVTTNQNLDNIDRAVLRPGRLLRRITVDGLRRPDAERVLERLGGRVENLPTQARYTLGQLYELSNRAAEQR